MADKKRHEYLLAPEPIPKTRRAQCAVPEHPDPPFDEPNPDDLQSIEGGTITAKTLTITGTHNLNASLTIITVENLVIDGIIEAPNQSDPGAAGVDIVLVSLEQDVKITANSRIGTGFGAPGANAPVSVPGVVANPQTTAVGGAGTNGGTIQIIAPKGSILIEGNIEGIGGGDGGAADALGSLTGKLTGGAAHATSGNGAAGGWILFINSNVNANKVVAGSGANARNATAIGGNGNAGNKNGRGGTADAYGGRGGEPGAGNPPAKKGQAGAGGDADATPGDGGDGGAKGAEGGYGEAVGGRNGDGVKPLAELSSPIDPAGTVGGLGEHVRSAGAP
jgi:hypothetical protein